MTQRMKIQRSILAVLMAGFWMFFPGLTAEPVFAAKVNSGTKRSLSLQLYNLSGFGKEKQILARRKVPASFLIAPRILRSLGLSEAHIDIVDGIYTGAFNANQFYGEKLKKITKNYNRAHINKSIKFFRSPVGRKMVSLNLKAMKASTKSYHNFLNKVIEKMPDKERLRLLNQLLESMGIVEYVIEREAGILRLTNPVGQEMKAPHSEILINRLRSEYQEQLRSLLLLRMMYDYRSLSNREMNKLVKFYKSPAGQWYKKVTLEGNLAGFATVNRRALRKMEKILKLMESGNQDMKTTHQVFAPGLRYLFSEKRDPFDPLVIPEEDQPEKKAPPPPPAEPGVPRVSSAEVLREEIESIPSIPYVLYEKIKEKNPRLYSDLEYYGALFKNKNALGIMKPDDLREEISQYKELIARAQEEAGRMVTTPLQANLNELILTGVMWDEKETVGLIQTPDEKGHTIRIGSFVGPDFGVVQSISADRVVLLERLRKYDGRIITVTQFIEFPNPEKEE